MYDVSSSLPTSHLERGTSVLCRGPPMSGKRSLGTRTIAAGLAVGEGAVVITAQRGSSDLRAELEEFDTSKLAVIDCAAGSSVETTDDVTVAVASPADLTGIGIGVTKALSQLHENGVERNRLFLDGLSALLTYTEFERVYRFCHTLVQHVEATGSLGVMTVDAEAMAETDAESIRALFPVVVDLDVTDDGTVYRIVTGDERTDFEPVPWTDRPPADIAEHTVESDDEPPISALSELLARVESRGQTLTLFDPGPTTDLTEVRAFFERQNVSVETVAAPEDGPRGFAVLHRDGDYAAAAPIPELRDAVSLNGIEEAPSPGSAGERLLERLDAVTFGTSDASVREMVRISRSIERTAWRTGTGTLHAGFQRLSRVGDEWGTRRVYERIADRGVDVHLYGVPDHETALEERFAVHGDDGDEIADSWFVLLDADEGRRGLVCEERGERRYSGFWTFDPGLVTVAVDYLERTY